MSPEKVYDPAATAALFEAVDENRVADALAALDNGADPNGKQGDADNSPLMICALHHLPPVSKALLEKGADPDYRRKGGDTALMLCAFSNDRTTARLIVDAGANILIQNFANEDAMMCANKESNRELGQLFRQWAEERGQRRARARAQAELRQNIEDAVSTVQAGIQAPLQVRRPLRLKGGLHV